MQCGLRGQSGGRKGIAKTGPYSVSFVSDVVVVVSTTAAAMEPTLPSIAFGSRTPLARQLKNNGKTPCEDTAIETRTRTN
jgi:hypothetical protein